MTRPTSELSLDEIRHALSNYALCVASPPQRLKSGVANLSYLVETQRDPVVLTVLDNHDEDSAKRLVELTNRLLSLGVSTPPIWPMLNGAQIAMAPRGQPIVVRPFVRGQEADARNPLHCHAIGASLAQVHRNVDGVRYGDDVRRLPNDWRKRLGECDDEDLIAWIAQQESALAAVDQLDLPRGFTHGDLFPDNVVVQGVDDVVLLDWETYAHEFFVYDLAITILGVGLVDLAAGIHLLAGYEKHRPLQSEERRYLGICFDYACALLAFNRYHRHNILYPNTGRTHLYQSLFGWCRNLSESDRKTLGIGSLPEVPI
ncbi:MAG TPA: phosphotransferase [Polyangium sp.]|nr:phosphotransferase [Polyangium sp.]